MDAANRTITSGAVLFAGLGGAFFGAAVWAGYGLVPAALMAVLLAGSGWFGLRTVLERPTHPPVRRSGLVLLGMSVAFLLVGAVVLALRPPAGPLVMQIVSGGMPLVGIVIYWNVLARKRATEG